MFNHCFKVRSLILATALISGLGLVTHATAQELSLRSFIVDLNSQTVTELGTLGSLSLAQGINDAGQVVGWSHTPVPLQFDRSCLDRSYS